MSVLLRAAQVFGLGPRKSSEEIADEIAEELAFHLEQRARELEEQGLSPEEARARALQLFGDVERTARECAGIQLGERITLVRIQWGLIAILLGLLGFVLWKYAATVANLRHQAMVSEIAIKTMQGLAAEQEAQAAMLTAPEPHLRKAVEDQVELPAPESLEDRVARWRASLAERPEDWRHAAQIFREVLALPPDEAFEVVAELWPELSVAHKEQAIKSFAGAEHARMLAVIHLGATDEAPTVQGRAFLYLKPYAFRNFADDYDAYLRWAELWRDRPLEEVLMANARTFLQELRMLSPFELKSQLIDFERLMFHNYGDLGLALPQFFCDEGALALVAEWLECPEFRDGDFSLGVVAFSWVESLQPDEAWMREYVLPYVDHPDEGIAIGALSAFGGPSNAWAVPEILEALARAKVGSDDLPNFAISVGARALAEIGDPAAIPAMIGLIAANPCYDTIYGIGYNGLGKLTGVSYDESHDGNWWIAWWELNKGRFPPEVSVLPIPKY